MKTLTITLPPPSAKLHAHAKGHWRSKSKATKQLREMACMITRQVAKGEQWKRASIVYRFYFQNRIRRDAANCVQSQKAAIDGVVDAGLLPDDSWEFLTIGGVECSVDKKNPRTELVFTMQDARSET